MPRIATATLAFLFAATTHAKTLDLPLPWMKLGAKSYTLTIERERVIALYEYARSVSAPLTMRAVSRGDADGIVRWEFGPARVEGDECEQDAYEVQLAMPAGGVRPALELRIEDSGSLVEVVNRKQVRDALMAMLAEHPQPDCAETTPAEWNEYFRLDSDGKALAGNEAKVFLTLLGAPLDTTEPTVYDDVLDCPFAFSIEAKATWRVVSEDARNVVVEWSRSPDPELAPNSFRKAAEELRSMDWDVEADEMEGRESAHVVIDRKTGWPVEISYERFARAGTRSETYRVRFKAR